MNSFEKRPIDAYQPKIDERDDLTEKTPNLFDKPTESCIKNVSGSPPSESSFFLLCRRCAVKDGCLSSRESGMEACIQPSREIYLGEAIYI